VPQRQDTSTTVADVDLLPRVINEPETIPDAPDPMARGTGTLEPAVLARNQATTERPRGPSRGASEERPDGDRMRALIFAPDRTRATWIEGELARAPVTIQLARRVRTVVAALIKDPPPRPQLLIVDFDAVSPAELFELHAVRHEGWEGRLSGIGDVPLELCNSLDIDQVIPALVRDSLLDCVAGTRHATETVRIPIGTFAALGLASERSEK
jgi:hypothetical protein